MEHLLQTEYLNNEMTVFLLELSFKIKQFNLITVLCGGRCVSANRSARLQHVHRPDSKSDRKTR